MREEWRTGYNCTAASEDSQAGNPALQVQTGLSCSAFPFPQPVTLQSSQHPFSRLISLTPYHPSSSSDNQLAANHLSYGLVCIFAPSSPAGWVGVTAVLPTAQTGGLWLAGRCGAGPGHDTTTLPSPACLTSSARPGRAQACGRPSETSNTLKRLTTVLFSLLCNSFLKAPKGLSIFS